jgi:uncharacterized iron-regulated membrane protein
LQHPDWPAVVASNEALATALERIAHSAAADEITAIDLPTERLPVWQAYTAQDRRHYFDAQRGEWLLTRDVRSDWLLWVRDLHTHLLAGEIGEQVAGNSPACACCCCWPVACICGGRVGTCVRSQLCAGI